MRKPFNKTKYLAPVVSVELAESKDQVEMNWDLTKLVCDNAKEISPFKIIVSAGFSYKKCQKIIFVDKHSTAVKHRLGYLS